MGQRIGARQAIFLAIGVYLMVSIWAAFMNSSLEFYILAIIVGLVQGGIQAMSRSFYARIIPVHKSAEYFGFYNMLGKFSAILGPVLMGGVGLFIRSWGVRSVIASRISITSVAVFFIAGGILLTFVDEKRGQQELDHLA
jgi:UMF1 family MFS transporter